MLVCHANTNKMIIRVTINKKIYKTKIIFLKKNSGCSAVEQPPLWEGMAYEPP